MLGGEGFSRGDGWETRRRGKNSSAFFWLKQKIRFLPRDLEDTYFMLELHDSNGRIKMIKYRW